MYSEAKALGTGQAAIIQGQAARVLGWHARWTGDFQAAQNHMLEALRLLDMPQYLPMQAEAMAAQAVVLYSQGRQDEAAELIREALTYLGPEQSIPTRIDLYVVQSTIDSYSGAYEAAQTLIDEAITLAKKSGFEQQLPNALNVQARILMRIGKPEDAALPAVEAVKVARQTRNAVVLPYTLEFLAAVRLANGQPEEAVELARHAAELGEKRHDQRVTCQALDALGKAQHKLKLFDDALKTLNKGLHIAEEIDYPIWQRWFLLGISNTLEAIGDLSGALSTYKTYFKLDQALFRKEAEARMVEMRARFDLLRAEEVAEVERSRAAELAEAHQAAEVLARTDRLTKLSNREGLDQHLESVGFLKDNASIAFVVVDLDHFKPINDTYGHAAGDRVLVEISERLSRLVRDNDIVARIGGDEFAMMVGGVKTSAQARDLGERLIRIFSEPVTVKNRPLDVSGSIGIALSETVGHQLSKLMSAADQAMYGVKEIRGPAYNLFCARSAGDILDLNVREVLRKAIAEGQIQPWFQPKVDICTGQIQGFEALARWVKPNGQIVQPTAFLPLIKQHNLQGEFTFAILRRSLQQQAVWSTFDMPTPSIAVNMLEELLASPEAVQDIDQMLQEFTPHRNLVTLEITEDVFFDRAADAIRSTIQQLGESGIQFSMDDFGTGYGSFLHLRELQVHEMKIDMEFVQGIGVDRSAEVIIEGFIAIAKGLGICVAAEGIETEEQAAFLTARDCFVGQGFLFGKALSAKAAEELLLSQMDQNIAAPIRR